MDDRITNAVARLRLQPGDEVLEIGCGHGVALSLIIPHLTRGHVLAIDRSDAMIAAARKRNADAVAAGRLELRAAAWEEFDPGARRFDAVLALRVAVLHRDPVATVARLGRWLRPGARVVIECDAPGAARPRRITWPGGSPGR